MQKVKILKQVNGSYEPVVDCAAQFNPEKLKLDKKASWKTEKTWKSNIGNTVFSGGDPMKLSVELFFDTTDSQNGDVRQFTEPLMALTLVNLNAAGQIASPEEVKQKLEAKKKELDAAKKQVEDTQKALDPLPKQFQGPLQQQLNQQQAKKQELEKQIAELEAQSKGVIAGSKAAPPKCKFVWGSFSFIAIVDSVSVTYIMFRSDGTPVRAKANVKMTQVEEESLYPAQNPTSRSAPRKVWVVQEGQRLDWIAYQEYNDSSMWRYLAEINQLDNPRQLRPGQILNLI